MDTLSLGGLAGQQFDTTLSPPDVTNVVQSNGWRVTQKFDMREIRTPALSDWIYIDLIPAP